MGNGLMTLLDISKITDDLKGVYDIDISKKTGYIYLLNFSGRLKIGRTMKPWDRIKTIVKTSGELPKSLYLFYTDDVSKIETKIHSKLRMHGIIGEYFKCSVKKAISEINKHIIPIDNETLKNRNIIFNEDQNRRYSQFSKDIFSISANRK